MDTRASVIVALALVHPQRSNARFTATIFFKLPLASKSSPSVAGATVCSDNQVIK
jgi:hypothetical protein